MALAVSGETTLALAPESRLSRGMGLIMLPAVLARRDTIRESR